MISFSFEHPRRPLIFLAVVVGHVTIIILMMHMRSTTKTERMQFVSTYIAIESPRVTTPAQRAVQTASARSSARASSEQVVANSTPTMPPAPQSTDWEAERERAATDLVARNLEEASSPLLSKPKVIERPKNGTRHQPGDSQRFDDGEVITRISEDCYATNRPPPGPQLDPNRLNIFCKRKKKPSQDDLFDHLKPEYLRVPDTPLPKFKGIFSEEAPCEYSALRCN